jgi:putative solute:sodium symporter small subunit
MDNPSNDYHISFFKPTTPQSVANRNMIVWFVCIWAVAIFGFQILLKVLEKPTPESTYLAFEKVWDNVKNGNASSAELQIFANASLSVLGKTTIAPSDKANLDNGLTWAVYQLSDAAQKVSVKNEIEKFKTVSGQISNISDPHYINTKNSLIDLVSPIIAINPKEIRAKIIPFELVSSEMVTLSEPDKEAIAKTMSLYLIHNQSFLTDFKFLGFPFHYFYTAIFLLIMFVGLCWFYCVRTDQINAKLNIID